MFYVPIGGISDSVLEFLGYHLVHEGSDFALYRDYQGDEYIVQKSNPFLMVKDFNDAQALQRAAQNGSGFAVQITL